MAQKNEANYFDMFITSVEYVCTAAKDLLDLVKNYTDVERKVKAIHKIEDDADQHFHLLYHHLMRSFMTPIDREDILALAQKIDDVTDLIEDIAYRFVMFDLKTVTPATIPFVELIVRNCDLLLMAVKEFKNFAKSKDLPTKIIQINNIEAEGDTFYQDTVRQLFLTSKDAIEIMIWREIYHKMEDTLDGCEAVADLMDGIVVKNT